MKVNPPMKKVANNRKSSAMLGWLGATSVERRPNVVGDFLRSADAGTMNKP